MDSDAQQYYAEATRWDVDRCQLLRQAARRAWLAALTSCGLALLLGAALLTLVPLKQVEPFVVRVDAAAGMVDVVPIYTATAALPESITRHLVMEYVTQRERYVPAIAEVDYDQVGAYQTAAMNQAWAAAWERANPDSPLNRYSDGSHVSVSVHSISFLKHNAASGDVIQVRFTTDTKRGAGGTTDAAHFVATLASTYGPPSGDVRLRALNPLGFKVLEYRREPESPGAEPEPRAGVTTRGGGPS